VTLATRTDSLLVKPSFVGISSVRKRECVLGACTVLCGYDFSKAAGFARRILGVLFCFVILVKPVDGNGSGWVS